jgi:hypothetical protein
LGNGGHVHHEDIITTIGVTAYGLIGMMLGVDQTIAPRLISSGEEYTTAISIQFE